MPKLSKQLADRLAITDAVYRYAQGVDAHDPDLMRSALAKDVEIEFAPGFVVRGHDGLKAAQEDGSLVARVAGGVQIRETTHAMVNLLIQLDGKRATGQVHVLVAIIGTKDGKDVVKLRGVRHLDEYARIDGEWRITRRKHLPSWVFDAEGTLSTGPF